jgi:hypothetical protein
LTQKHATHLLERVWHVTGAFTLSELKSEVLTTLREYLSSHDAGEVMRVLRELAVPHFYHEVVYRGIVLVANVWPAPTPADKMGALFAALLASEVVTAGAVVKGFARAVAALPDLVVDSPAAAAAIAALARRVNEARPGTLPEDGGLAAAAAAAASAGAGAGAGGEGGPAGGAAGGASAAAST